MIQKYIDQAKEVIGNVKTTEENYTFEESREEDICQKYDYEYGKIQIFGDGAEAVADLSESTLHGIVQMIENALEKAED